MEKLSVYSTLDPSDESAHTLLLKVDKFEVHTKLERQVVSCMKHRVLEFSRLDIEMHSSIMDMCIKLHV